MNTRKIRTRAKNLVLISAIFASVVIPSSVFAAEKNSIRERAVDTLYERLKLQSTSSSKDSKTLDKSSIKVISENAMRWPDASIGCARTDLAYPQVITPGHQVILESGGKRYYVHMSDVRAIVCDKPSSKLSHSLSKARMKNGKPVKPNAFNIDKLSRDAKHDLAQKIGVNEKDIEIRSLKSVTWPNQGLGCMHRHTNAQEQDRKPKKVKGYRLVLKAAGREYTYHTDSNQRVMACPEIAEG